MKLRETQVRQTSALATGPRVLFVAPFEPWARENGSSVVIADLLEGLVANESASILPVFLRRSPAAGVRSRVPAAEGHTLGIEPWSKWLSVPFAVMTGKSPFWESRIPNRLLARRIANLVRARNYVPDLIHIEHLVLVPIGRMLADEFNCRLVYRAHNTESQLWTRRLGGRGWQKLIKRHLERREARFIDMADLTLCISDVDLRWARQHAPNARSELLPVGLRFERLAAHSQERPAHDRIAFVGGLNWAPNEVGLSWFVNSVLPIVRSKLPSVKLAVLARGAESRPWLSENPAIDLVPQSTSPVELFATSKVSIAPLLEGGGVRIKILESLAVGCPVVATAIGGEGLASPGLTHVDDPTGFAHACVSQLLKTNARSERADISRAIESNHGAVVVARQLARRWSELCGAGATSHA
jgi:glycosyltransferase involved in cell wall biosynthesis